MSDDEKREKPLLRDAASVFAAFLVVFGFCAVGYTVMASQFVGTPVEPPADWLAAMLSLASAALGYLIGKHEKPKAKDDGQRPLCSTCPLHGEKKQ